MKADEESNIESARLHNCIHSAPTIVEVVCALLLFPKTSELQILLSRKLSSSSRQVGRFISPYIHIENAKIPGDNLAMRTIAKIHKLKKINSTFSTEIIH